MTTSPRTRALVALALALLAACASSGSKRGAETPRPSQGDPTVSSRDIENSANTPVEEVLRGKISGVTVSRAQDGGLLITVRGTTSVNASNAPLYIIDGVPIQPSASGSLQGINPYDIESIKVLKDPASLTMYGSRGANGVILIATKSARRR